MYKLLCLLSVTVVLVFIVACAAPVTPEPTKAPTATTVAVAPPATTAPGPTVAPKPTEVPKPTETKAPPKGGTVRRYLTGNAISMNPMMTSDTTSTGLQDWIWAHLVKRDPVTLDIVGVLYEDKPTFSADGKTMTWKLRPGLKWSDGQPLTSADVEFTWKTMMDPKTKLRQRATFEGAFTDVKALDPLTVQYTLKDVGFCPAADQSDLIGVLPKHIYEKLDINVNPENTKPTVVNGPWMFKSWAADEQFTAGPPNKHYVLGEPNIETVSYRNVKDATVALQLFKTQEIDIVGPAAQDWEEVKKLPFANTYEYYTPGASWTYIGFNTRNPWLADKKVRQAISHAVDVDGMIKNIRQGLAKRQYSLISPTNWAYTDDVPKFPYDPAKAKQLLKDLGWTPGADGILQKDGKPWPKMRIYYSAGTSEREKIAMIAQENLKAIGIPLEVIGEESAAYSERRGVTRDMEFFIHGWSPGIEPYGTGEVFISTSTRNHSGIKNLEFDKAFEQASYTPGCKQADRKVFYVKAAQILADEQPYIWIWATPELLAVNKRLTVNPMSPLGVLYDPFKWYINP